MIQKWFRYAVYHYLRSLGWVVRSGTYMGSDWTLYKLGRVFISVLYILFQNISLWNINEYHVYCVMKSGSMEYLGTNSVNSKMLSTFVSMLIEQVASLLWNPSSSELVVVSSPQLITFINRTAQIFFVCMSTLVMTGHFKVLRFTTPPSVSG